MRHENRKHESSMELWAEKEILIAIKREQDGYKKEAEKSGYKSDINEFSSIKSLYESAFKAYRLLLKNGPSGMSWAFMASVLRRLMDHQPLTPLMGTDDEWVLASYSDTDDGREEMYQNARCSTVFKHVWTDGTITYSDANRTVCIDANDGGCLGMGLGSNFVDEMYPITFPYMPPRRPYRVIERVFGKNGGPREYDTIGVLRLETPDGRIELVNRFYKKDENGKFVRISKEEYEHRLESYKSSHMNNFS